MFARYILNKTRIIIKRLIKFDNNTLRTYYIYVEMSPRRAFVFSFNFLLLFFFFIENTIYTIILPREQNAS